MAKAQIWTMDLIAGISVFMIAIVIYFVFTNNISNYDDTKFEELYSSSIVLSDSLLTEGYPFNWTSGNVTEIGLTNNNHRINESKIYNFKNLDYLNSKGMLKTRFDYLFYFEDDKSDLFPVNGTDYFGKPTITKDNIKTLEDPSHLITTKRFVIFEDKILIMVIYVWR